MMPRQSPFAVLFDRFFSANGFYLIRDDLTSSYAIIRHNIRTFRSAGVLAVVKGRHKAESELKKFEGKRVGNRILDWWGLSMPCSPGRRGQFGDALNRSISQTGQHVAEIIADWDLVSAAAFDYR